MTKELRLKYQKIVLEMVENIVGKGENAGNQHFLLSHNVFKYCFFLSSFKVMSFCGKVL